MDLHVLGPCYTYVFANIANCTLIWSYILIFKPIRLSILGSDCTDCCNSLGYYWFMIFKLSLISFVDLVRLVVFPVTISFYSLDLKYSFILALNLFSISYSLLMAFQSLTNIIISYYLGKQDITNAKTLYKYFWNYGLILGLSIIFILFIFSTPLVNIILGSTNSNHNDFSITKTMFIAVIINNTLNMPLEVLINCFKVLGEFTLAFTVFIIMNIINFILLYVMIFIGFYGIPKVLLVHVIYLLMQNIILFLFVQFYFDWKECKENLEIYKMTT